MEIMDKVKKIVGVLVAALMLVGVWSLSLGHADAATGKPTAAQIKKICATSGRGDALYRTYCMRNGTVQDAAHRWYAWVPLGVKGKEQQGGYDRRSICKFAVEDYSSVHDAAYEIFYDPAYDAFHNHRQVLRWMGDFARVDCRSMGYTV